MATLASRKRTLWTELLGSVGLEIATIRIYIRSVYESIMTAVRKAYQLSMRKLAQNHSGHWRFGRIAWVQLACLIDGIAVARAKRTASHIVSIAAPSPPSSSLSWSWLSSPFSTPIAPLRFLLYQLFTPYFFSLLIWHIFVNINQNVSALRFPSAFWFGHVSAVINRNESLILSKYVESRKLHPKESIPWQARWRPLRGNLKAVVMFFLATRQICRTPKSLLGIFAFNAWFLLHTYMKSFKGTFIETLKTRWSFPT